MELDLNQSVRLNDIIQYFYDAKTIADDSKKEADNYNKEIKDLMAKMDITNYTTIDGLQAKLTVQKRENFNEEKLITKLKELGITTPIKTVEVVDMDELENVIYNGGLDASELTSCKQIKEILVLKVTKKKGVE